MCVCVSVCACACVCVYRCTTELFVLVIRRGWGLGWGGGGQEEIVTCFKGSIIIQNTESLLSMNNTEICLRQIKVVKREILGTDTQQKNKALCDSWAPHRKK